VAYFGSGFMGLDSVEFVVFPFVLKRVIADNTVMSCVCVLAAVFAKGQTVTGPYRFLARYGGYVWLETSASVVTKSAFEEPQIVVCINHTIGYQ